MTQTSDLWPGDFYRMRETLPAEDQALLAELRAFLAARVAPDINAYWIRAEFPHHLVPEIARLGIVGASYKGYGFPGRSPILDGFIAGTGACRLLDRHLRRRPRRAVGRLDLSLRLGRAKGALAAGDGADGEAGLVRPDRA